jgi:transposase
MACRYRPTDRDQRFLLPPDMAEWLPAGHLAWFVLEVVDQLDTSAFHRRHPGRGPGRSAYNPDMVLALLIYAYALGERSSRQIERLCGTDVAFRVICAQDPPDHTTIARFRATHQDAFAEVFGQVLALCAGAGMGRVGVVAIDGTKIAANASMGANRTEEWLEAEIRRILAEAAASDAAEDDRFGPARGDEVPAEFTDPRTRAARIRTALRQVQDKNRRAEQVRRAARDKAEEYLRRVEAGEAPPGRPPAGIDPLRLARARLEREQNRARDRDPDQAKKGKSAISLARRRVRRAEAKHTWEQTAATARPTKKPTTPPTQHSDPPRRDTTDADTTGAETTDAETTDAETTDAETTDAETTDAETTGAETTEASATPVAQTAKTFKANITDPDSQMMSNKQGWLQGYNAQLAVSDDHLILATVLTMDPTDTLSFEPMMHAAAAAVEVIAAHQPHRKEPVAIGTLVVDAGYHSHSNLTSEGPDRLIALGAHHDLHRDARRHPASGPPPEHLSPTEQMRHRLHTPEGRAIYQRRAATVEPVNAHLKDQVGLRRFSRRGLTAAASELHLAAAVVNLLKLRTHIAT